jgi:hypothetical protein
MPQVRTVVLLAWPILLTPLCRADDLAFRSVCEVLRNRSQFNGRNVIVVGRIASSMESSYLIGDCGPNFVADGFEWGYDISLDYVQDKARPAPPLPADFAWDPNAILAMLPTYAKVKELRAEPNCGFRSEWAAVFGRFETHDKFPTWKSRDGTTNANGFGHLGGSPAQIIYPRKGKFCLVSNEDKYGPAGIEPERMLWLRIRGALSSESGEEYFQTSMKDALVPGGVVNVHMLKGTVIAAIPATSPKVLLVGIFKSTEPDARLELDSPLGKRVEPGTQVEFQGVATEFAKNPLLVTFKVSGTDLLLRVEPKR